MSWWWQNFYFCRHLSYSMCRNAFETSTTWPTVILQLFAHFFRFTSLMLFPHSPFCFPVYRYIFPEYHQLSPSHMHCISLPSFIFVSRLFCLLLESFCACHPQPWHHDSGFWKGTEASRQLIIRAENLEGCTHTDTSTNPHENIAYTNTHTRTAYP